jgi:4-amino-4-deoxy-L-arabinose transferase-like glycosyltransferase
MARPPVAAGGPDQRLLVAVITLSIALRVAVAVLLGDRAEPISGAFDQYSYDMLARRLSTGFGFTFPIGWYPFTQPGEATAHWSYLYTGFLAAVYLVFGHHPLAARLIQSIFSGLGCWLIYRIGARLFDPRAGLAAAALTAGYAYFIFFDAALMTQSTYIVALLAAVDQALLLRERPSATGSVVLGLALGTGTLLRQTLLLFAPVLLGWAARPRDATIRWRGALLSAATIVLIVAPWTAYNWITFDDFLLLNSNGGFFLYSSNHPSQGVRFDPNLVAPLPESLAGLPEPALDRALYREAVKNVAGDPMRFLRLSLSRVPHYYQLLPSADSDWISNAARLCSFTLYLPFMLAGLVLSRPRWRLCLPIYLYLCFDAALHLASWAAPRYRLPSDALAMVFAGLAVSRAVQRILPRAGAARFGSTADSAKHQSPSSRP